MLCSTEKPMCLLLLLFKSYHSSAQNLSMTSHSYNGRDDPTGWAPYILSDLTTYFLSFPLLYLHWPVASPIIRCACISASLLFLQPGKRVSQVTCMAHHLNLIRSLVKYELLLRFYTTISFKLNPLLHSWTPCCPSLFHFFHHTIAVLRSYIFYSFDFIIYTFSL